MNNIFYMAVKVCAIAIFVASTFTLLSNSAFQVHATSVIPAQTSSNSSASNQKEQEFAKQAIETAKKYTEYKNITSIEDIQKIDQKILKKIVIPSDSKVKISQQTISEINKINDLIDLKLKNPKISNEEIKQKLIANQVISTNSVSAALFPSCSWLCGPGIGIFSGLATDSEIYYCSINLTGCGYAKYDSEIATNYIVNNYCGGNRNNQVDGTRSNATKHAYWNALMARDIGAYWAENFANAHEQVNNYNPYGIWEGYTNLQHTMMDLANNKTGRQIYQDNVVWRWVWYRGWYQDGVSNDQLINKVIQKQIYNQLYVLNNSYCSR